MKLAFRQPVILKAFQQPLQSHNNVALLIKEQVFINGPFYGEILAFLKIKNKTVGNVFMDKQDKREPDIGYWVWI